MNRNFSDNLNDFIKEMSDVDEEVRTIKQFRPGVMKKSYTALHIGPPGAGKTHTMIALSYIQQHLYPVGQATCGTEATQGSFTPIFGGLFTDERFHEDVQQRASARQQRAKTSKCPNYHSYHIVDDCGYNKKNLKNTNVVESIKNGTQWLYRAYHVGIHSPKEVHDELTGFNYVFVYSQKEASLRRLLWNMYFRAYLPEFKDFDRLMSDMFDNKYGALVIDVKKQSSKLEECVSIFRPPFWKWPKTDGEDSDKVHPVPEGWRFGCQQFIDWNDARLNKNYIPDYIANLSG